MREFLHLLMSAIGRHNGFFTGEDFNRMPSPNLPGIRRQTYKHIGEMFAVSLIYGGPPPTFLSPSAVTYIVHGLTKVNAAVDEVPDPSIRTKLKQVNFYIIIIVHVPVFCSRMTISNFASSLCLSWEFFLCAH